MPPLPPKRLWYHCQHLHCLFFLSFYFFVLLHLGKGNVILSHLTWEIMEMSLDYKAISITIFIVASLQSSYSLSSTTTTIITIITLLQLPHLYHRTSMPSTPPLLLHYRHQTITINLIPIVAIVTTYHTYNQYPFTITTTSIFFSLLQLPLHCHQSSLISYSSLLPYNNHCLYYHHYHYPHAATSTTTLTSLP